MASRNTRKSPTATRAAVKRVARPPENRVSRWIRAHPFCAFAIASLLLSFALYGRVLQAPFVYDDLEQVVGNPSLLSWHAFAARFLEHSVALSTVFRGRGGLTYRPVFWLSIALDRHVWDLNAAGFHLTNVALHLANIFLLFLLLRRYGASPSVSTSAALLWLALPINVEVIAWISARSYSLATAFVLLGLLCALRSLDSAHLWLLPPYGLFCLVAMLANEIGLLVLPLTALLCLDRRMIWKRAGPVLATASLAVAGAWTLRRSLGIQQSGSGAAYSIVGLEFWKYLGWMIVPTHMSVERSTSVPETAPSVTAVLAWVGLVAIAALGLALWRRWPLVSFGLTWMTLCLLPFCGFIFVYQGMAERYTYLATIGLAIALAGAFPATPSFTRSLGLGVLGLWVAWGAWRGVERMRDWVDPVALYQHSLDATPNSPSLAFNLGYTLKENGDLPGAEQAFLRVLQLRPGYPKVNASLGDVYLAEGRLADAQGRYAAELAQDPGAYETLLNSAIAFQRSGAIELAEQQDKKAISVDPGASGAYTNLGALYLQQNRPADAEDMFTRAIQAQPTDPSPYFDLAVLFQQAHRLDQARRLYAKVLTLKPGDADTLANLAAMR